MTSARLVSRATALLGLLAALSPARADEPGTDGPAPAEVLIGPLDGAVSSARIGLVANDTRFLAYVCSQDEAFNTACSRWTTGAVKGGQFEGKSADGKVSIRGAIQDGTARGTVAAGDKEMAFSAKRVADPLAAGLFRAEEKEGETDEVAGWVVDDDGTVAGAVQNRRTGQVVTPPPPKKGQQNAQTPVTRTGRAGQPVTDPANPPAGRGAKRFTAAVKQEKEADLQANVAGAGGSPLLALTIQQVKRFNSGAKPANALEERTFAKLAKLPGNSLTDYVRNWEELPQKTRQAILGPAGAQVAANQPLTANQVGSVLRRAKAGAKPAPKAAGTAQVRTVRVTQLKCVNRTDVAFADEVFASYLVLAGDVAADKTTQIITGLRNGDTRTFSAADVGVFPPAGATQPATQDVFIAAGLFDDDSQDKVKVLQLVNTLIDVAASVLETVGQDKIAQFADEAKKLLEGLTAALPDTKFMGSDTLVVKPNKATVSETGQPKTVLTVRKLKNNGNVKFHYELRGIQVN